MKHQFIEANRRSYSVKTMCRVLQVSTSGCYAARKRPLSQRSERQALLTSRIQAIHAASLQTYGAPCVHAEHATQGTAYSHTKFSTPPKRVVFSADPLSSLTGQNPN